MSLLGLGLSCDAAATDCSALDVFVVSNSSTAENKKNYEKATTNSKYQGHNVSPQRTQCYLFYAVTTMRVQ